jgi:serine/threonine protein kinase
MTATACLSDDDLIGYTSGGLDRDRCARIEEHLDACSRCLAAVGSLARGSNAAPLLWTTPLPPRLLAEGDVISNRYSIRRVLGAGAMGEVYEAEDRLLGKTIALKTLNSVVAADPNALARLRSEVALAHQVTHPNVCRIYDIGVDGAEADGGGEPLRFLTMEFLDGQTLSAFLRDEGAPPLDRAYLILTQLASALAAAHEVGVIHRDLKGDNVMLVKQAGGQLRAVVTDFGLAGPVLPADVRATAERLAYSGIRTHVAPEQLAGKPASPTTDVYSFGLLAYQVLTGKPPSPVAAGANFLPDRLEALREAGSGDVDVVARWDRFLRLALHPDASRRFPNGAALETALLAVGARRVQTRRWTTAAVSVSLALAGVLVLGARRQPESPPTDRQAPIVVKDHHEPKASAPPSAPTLAPTIDLAGSAGRPAIAAPVRLRRTGHAALRPLADRAAAAAGAQAVAPAKVEPIPADRDEIVRDLPPRSPSVASQADLADPFAARKAAPPGGDR